jgi:hypothetical protein
MPISPIDERILDLEQTITALNVNVKDSMIAINESIKALRKAMTSKELVETPRQFANQEEPTEEIFIRL